MATVAVLCRHVAAVIRVGLLCFEERRARCRRPSAPLSLMPTSDRLPALGHSGQLRETSVFAVEDFAVHVGWPVVMQFGAVRVSAHPISHPLGARVLVSQVFHCGADGGVVCFADRVSFSTICRCAEPGTKFERKRV